MTLALGNPFLQRNFSPPRIIFKKVVDAKPNRPQWSCRKKEIHPHIFQDSKVFCNNELVMTTGGTQKEYVVDVWSGNHPFYLGDQNALVLDTDQVAKFRRRFGELTELMEIPVLTGVVEPLPKRKIGKGSKK